jgi:hypothetical protein
MPLGEAIGEILLRGIIELIFYGVCYWAGWMVLKVASFGAIRIAPLSTIYDRNPSEKKRFFSKRSIWLQRGKKARALKAECVVVVGMLFWAGVALVWWFGFDR